MDKKPGSIETFGTKDPERIKYEKEVATIEARIKILDQEIYELEFFERQEREGEKAKAITREKAMRAAAEAERIEKMVTAALDDVEEGNDETIISKLRELKSKIGESDGKKTIVTLLERVRRTVGRQLKRKIMKFFFLPLGAVAAVALSYRSPEEYYNLAQNYKERHFDKVNEDDQNIAGIHAVYESPNIQRSTYDFLGEEKINYKSGYYTSMVFDLTDRTPPKFKIINRGDAVKMDAVLGITTNLFRKFEKISEMADRLKINESAAQMAQVPVIGYNTKTQTVRAGHLAEFDEDWIVSHTYEIALDFKLNEDGTVNLTYVPGIFRMAPQTAQEDGASTVLPIGISRDQTKKRIKPSEANRFGVLEGGKVIMTCGDRQLQVNGSFADIFRVYERLKKEYPGTPIKAYGLDNGAYNLPILYADKTLTPARMQEHLSRHVQGGTALVLMNDGAISPYEYKNQYTEIEHPVEGYVKDPSTGVTAKNKHSTIVIHHVGKYKNPKQAIKDFEDPTKERSGHVLILRDGTRHLFGTDDDVLPHAGKSEFNESDKVDLFSLGVAFEGDPKKGNLTLAQLESMLEYMRPRVEKYAISMENVTSDIVIADNYLKKHPGERSLLTKLNLNDKIWTQLRDLIAKKLYPDKNEKPKLKGDASKLMGALAYQDAYRITQNPDYASARLEEMLEAWGAREDIRAVEDWVKNFV